MKRIFRIYIDEFGCDGYQRLDVPSNRYLNLTGVIVERKDAYLDIHNDLMRLKEELFQQSPTNPIVLHRTCIRRANAPFGAFRSQAGLREEFDRRLIGILLKGNYKIVSVTFDKQLHIERREKQGLPFRNPYGWCMEWLMERYVTYLREVGGQGDVASEMRGRREDRALSRAFAELMERGSSIGSYKEDFQQRFTEKRLLLRDKKQNDTGIQLADVICKPAHKYILDYNDKEAMGNGFSAKLARHLVDAGKFRLNPRNNHPDGYGTKLLE